ncbi:hypothetical protein [Alloalcanivorax gelatiniphagus]|uniref:Uncharacterized protein n=1 Tax=Alloalcanivorax gelatiniphagus TaxID=1194167 RepID=A0ABY2XP45_9GAMM|nr:hypothetical protein [Alloalcanivorax gelatiniphagus]TMW14262.1 hypothetical protein FGS76_03775 [Alloalcanivorax gelatiniphagus]
MHGRKDWTTTSEVISAFLGIKQSKTSGPEILKAKSLLLLAALFCTPALAETAPESEFKARMERCKLMERFGETVMLARQSGMALSDTLETLNKDSSMPLLNAIAMKAWEVPRFSSEQLQLRAVNEFKDGIFHGCMEG